MDSRVVMGWIVDYLCFKFWDEFKHHATVDKSSDSTLLQGIMSQEFEDTDSRKKILNFLQLIVRLADGENTEHSYDDAVSAGSPLEEGLLIFDKVVSEMEDAEDVIKVRQMMRIQAVLVCCRRGEFDEGKQVMKSLWKPNNAAHPAGATERRLCTQLAAYVKAKKVNQTFLALHTYSSFIAAITALLKTIYDEFDDPFLFKAQKKFEMLGTMNQPIGLVDRSDMSSTEASDNEDYPIDNDDEMVSDCSRSPIVPSSSQADGRGSKTSSPVLGLRGLDRISPLRRGSAPRASCKRRLSAETEGMLESDVASDTSENDSPEPHPGYQSELLQTDVSMFDVQSADSEQITHYRKPLPQKLIPLPDVPSTSKITLPRKSSSKRSRPLPSTPPESPNMLQATAGMTRSPTRLTFVNGNSRANGTWEDEGHTTTPRKTNKQGAVSPRKGKSIRDCKYQPQRYSTNTQATPMQTNDNSLDGGAVSWSDISDDSTTRSYPIMNTSHKRRKKVRRPWDDEEVALLIKAVRHYGVGHWSTMMLHYKFKGRTNVNLKDKYRNMVERGEV